MNKDDELDKLRLFFREIMGWSFDASLDGGDAQDLALSLGLAKEELMIVPCGEVCSCYDLGMDDESMCVRLYQAED